MRIRPLVRLPGEEPLAPAQGVRYPGGRGPRQAGSAGPFASASCAPDARGPEDSDSGDRRALDSDARPAPDDRRQAASPGPRRTSSPGDRQASGPGVQQAPDSETRRTLSPEQYARYSRQIMLPGFGEEGQMRLLAARVLVVGAGGLGSAALAYLGAAGVGTIGIVDDDVVEPSNLHRQVIHDSTRIGASKAASAAARIRALNPDVEVVEHEARLTEANARELAAGYDVVLDGSDNFPTRYVVDTACSELSIPEVWAAIFQYSAQVSVFWSGARAAAAGVPGVCLRDLFPAPPEPGTTPSCGEAGVLGSLCGQVGSVMAGEAIKLLTGVGEPLIGRILVMDAWRSTYEEVPLMTGQTRDGMTGAGGEAWGADDELRAAGGEARSVDDDARARESGAGNEAQGAGASANGKTGQDGPPAVRSCTVSELAALLASGGGEREVSEQEASKRGAREQEANGPEVSEQEANAPEASAPETSGRKDTEVTVLDVRRPDERAICAIEGSVHIPLDDVLADPAATAAALGEGPVYIHCLSGARSLRAARALAAVGVDAVNVEGGIRAWWTEVDPQMRRY